MEKRIFTNYQYFLIRLLKSLFVMPAKAGIQKAIRLRLGVRFRWHNRKERILLILLFSSPLLLAAERFAFDSADQQMVFQETVASLRCLVCQNQSLAESHATFAEDLKKIIYTKVKAGVTKEVLIAELTDKYGDYLRYQPPLRFSTLFLWISPFLFLIFFIFNLRKTKCSS